MDPTVDDLRAAAERLRDALAVYDRFAEGWPYGCGPIPSEVDAYLTRRTGNSPETTRQAGVALASTVEEQYHDAREVQATYVQRTRERGRRDWTQIVAETEPVRTATRQVHTAGYGIDPETGQQGYLLPSELCPADRVSMNPGSSPVVYDERVVQYRAVVDQFDLSPEVVYHPGSGHDVSLSWAFPESRVVHVDVDEAAMTDLKRAGYEAIGADAISYELASGTDTIVFRNAGLLEEAIVEVNLQPGGWVFANDHLESVQHLSRIESLTLVGVVPDEWTGDSPQVETVESGDTCSRIESGSPLDLYVFRHER